MHDTTKLKKISGEKKDPDRILLIGMDKVGKSTWANGAPNPVFIGPESGWGEMSVTTTPEPVVDWRDLNKWVQSFAAGGHDRKTMVLDSIDWIEPMLHKHLCRTEGWKDIEAAGYGKGWILAADKIRELLSNLDECRMKAGMEIILISHSVVRTFTNPSGTDYSGYEMAVNKKLAAVVRQWVDTIGFAIHEATFKDKQRAVTGLRHLHVSNAHGWDAGSRWDLPPKLPLEYAAYAEARDSANSADFEAMASEAHGLLEKLKEHPNYDAMETDVKKQIANKKGRLLRSRVARLTEILEEMKETAA